MRIRGHNVSKKSKWKCATLKKAKIEMSQQLKIIHRSKQLSVSIKRKWMFYSNNLLISNVKSKRRKMIFRRPL